MTDCTHVLDQVACFNEQIRLLRETSVELREQMDETVLAVSIWLVAALTAVFVMYRD